MSIEVRACICVARSQVCVCTRVCVGIAKVFYELMKVIFGRQTSYAIEALLKNEPAAKDPLSRMYEQYLLRAKKPTFNNKGVYAIPRGEENRVIHIDLQKVCACGREACTHTGTQMGESGFDTLLERFGKMQALIKVRRATCLVVDAQQFKCRSFLRSSVMKKRSSR